MRISQKQAELLAQEIVCRIKKEYGAQYIPVEMQVAVRQYKAKLKVLDEKIEKAQKEKRLHEQTLSSVVGKANATKIRGYWDEDNIIEKLQEANTPSVHTIADKIILKSMFATPETMEEFVSGLVKEFKPKTAKLVK